MARLPRCRASPGAVCWSGPLAAGWLYDGLHHYEVAFWLCACAFLLAAIGIGGNATTPGAPCSAPRTRVPVMEADMSRKQRVVNRNRRGIQIGCATR